MAAAARAHVVKRFDAATVMPMYEAYYREVLGM
jgi:hypothetical protein